MNIGLRWEAKKSCTWKRLLPSSWPFTRSISTIYLVERSLLVNGASELLMILGIAAVGVVLSGVVNEV